jgi:hypothetical protein
MENDIDLEQQEYSYQDGYQMGLDYLEKEFTEFYLSKFNNNNGDTMNGMQDAINDHIDRMMIRLQVNILTKRLEQNRNERYWESDGFSGEQKKDVDP